MRGKREENDVSTLHEMEIKVYEEITKRQRLVLQSLQQKSRIKDAIESVKEGRLEKQSREEIIKHPYNGSVWMNLANFIQEDNVKLDEIEQRIRARQLIRAEMQRKHQQRQFQIIEGVQSKKEHQKKMNVKNVKTDKIPWKLMRQLRRRDVEQNRIRLNRIQMQQKNRMDDFHKY